MKRNEVWKSYHTPGMPNYAKRKRNAIFISTANTLKHEIGKLACCYRLRKEKKEFITEAVDNKTGLRRDIVCLDDGEIYEIETTQKRAARHDKSEVNVIMV